MSSPVAYYDFVNQNGAFVSDGGPWSMDKSSKDINCGTSQIAWCKDVTNCLSCWVFPSASESIYSVSFMANVSVPLIQYDNVNSLEYNFSYSINWASNKISSGYGLVSNLIVGDCSFSDIFYSDDYEELMHIRQTWAGTTFEHSGNATVYTYNNQPTVYIPIRVDLSFPWRPSAYINYYMKGATFRILSPSLLQSTNESSSHTTSNSALMTSSSNSPPVSSLSNSASMPSLSNQTSASSLSISNRLSPAAIPGIVLGATTAIVLLILFWLYRRRLQRKRDGRVPSPYSAWKSSYPVSVIPPLSNAGPRKQHGADPFQDPPRPIQAVTHELQTIPHDSGGALASSNPQRNIVGDRASNSAPTPPPAYTSNHEDEPLRRY
ncbi:hypothetical protein FRB91_002669 [Serendipita sp. 411]|nr:hypothetical protein FRB91_002669 [Serendipita sp. 411]